MAKARYAKDGKLEAKYFPIPKRVDRMLAWLNAARKVIPSIPMDSEVVKSLATPSDIEFHFKGGTLAQPHVLLIDRRAN